jgi:hypothetical protein
LSPASIGTTLPCTVISGGEAGWMVRGKYGGWIGTFIRA